MKISSLNSTFSKFKRRTADYVNCIVYVCGLIYSEMLYLKLNEDFVVSDYVLTMIKITSMTINLSSFLQNCICLKKAIKNI